MLRTKSLRIASVDFLRVIRSLHCPLRQSDRFRSTFLWPELIISRAASSKWTWACCFEPSISPLRFQRHFCSSSFEFAETLSLQFEASRPRTLPLNAFSLDIFFDQVLFRVVILCRLWSRSIDFMLFLHADSDFFRTLSPSDIDGPKVFGSKKTGYNFIFP